MPRLTILAIFSPTKSAVAMLMGASNRLFRSMLEGVQKSLISEIYSVSIARTKSAPRTDSQINLAFPLEAEA